MDGIAVQCKLLFPLLIASNLQCINITESLICDLNNLPVVILRSKMAVAEGCDRRKLHGLQRASMKRGKPSS